MERYDDPDDDDDLTALKQRREGLCAFADLIAEAIEGVETPETFIEADRAARYVTLADRMIVSLPHPAKSGVHPARKRLRRYADQLLDMLKDFPMPKTFLDGIHASRCVLAHDRMLTQLYTPPKLGEFIEESEVETDPKIRAITAFNTMMSQANRMTTNLAAQCGYWPDGTPYEPGTRSDSHNHFDAIDRITMAQDIEPHPQVRMAAMITARANALARTKALKTGLWPDGSRYKEGDAPDFYHISDRFDAEVRNIPPDPNAEPPDYIEQPGPTGGFPWWLVHRVKRSESG